jgi:photosystem II stability/assembly factor-like uncharacterized protein
VPEHINFQTPISRSPIPNAIIDYTLKIDLHISSRLVGYSEKGRKEMSSAEVQAFEIATGRTLMIVRHSSRWTVEQHLENLKPHSLAFDPGDPSRVYVGTMDNGLYRSTDAGRSWEPVGPGIPHERITAVAVQHDTKGTVVYAGTEPSTFSRSDDGGETWRVMDAMNELPSASEWSFPPKPETHHVRWIEPDPHQLGRLYVAIEAGALLRTEDGGETWHDRVPDGPFDTHNAATHPREAGRVYSAAGDGYYESEDGAQSWRRPMEGLRHRYLVGVAVDSGDPDTVIVSAASGPHVAYSPRNAEAYLYRKRADEPFELLMKGLPEGAGTVVSRLASVPDEPGVFYAVNNHGVFHSSDAGASWEALDIPWPEGVFDYGVDAFVALIDQAA